MIISNGTLSFLHSVEGSGGRDSSTGYAISRTEVAGRCFPCQFYSAGQNRLAKENGEPVVRNSYIILCEHVSPCEITERVRLHNRKGELVGDYSVRSIEPLDAVCQTKIIV